MSERARHCGEQALDVEGFFKVYVEGQHVSNDTSSCPDQML